MTHLTSDELIDAMDGALTPGRQAHLAACDECRRRIDDLSAVLDEAKQSTVPEPSPLFWNQFSRRVNEAIDTEPARWPRRLQWQVVVPFGATAMIILSLMMAVPRQDSALSVEAPVAIVEADEGAQWLALAELVGDLDIDTASVAGVIEPGTAEQAVLQLTAEEQQELTRLLQAELTRAKS